MARLRAEYEFEVEGLWIFDEVGERSIDFDRDGAQITISLPLYEEGSTDQRLYGSASETSPKGTARPLRRFTVAVTAEGAVGAADFGTSRDEAVERAHDFKLRQFEVARRIAADFIDDIRVRRNQPWLSPHPPRLIATKLVDTEAGKDLPVGWAPRLTVFVGAGAAAIDEDVLTGPIRTALSAATYPGVAEILLADARHHVIRADIKHEAAIALLLAAIAVEVKAKQSLRQKTSAERLALLDVVVDSPRDVTVAAANLLDRVARAVVGRSLRDDNLALFKRVDLLFQRRNAFAHRAEYPSETEARDATNAARAVFEWLDSL